MKSFFGALIILALWSPLTSAARDHKEHRPPTRIHEAINRQPLNLEPPTSKLRLEASVSIKIRGKYREIISNGVPQHLVGQFPNCGNPHQIKEQSFEFTIPLEPLKNDYTTQLEPGMAFGVAINGVPFEPYAAEWWKGRRDSEWRYEALSGAVALGADANHAHVQPGGKYHYHGLPTGLMIKHDVSKERHSKLIGWAADGFPIYSLYGFVNKKDKSAGIREFQSSFQLKAGERPGGIFNPGGEYDGAFNADYEYKENLGDLDMCNGVNTITPEFPNGTYAYFLTSNWPFVPRCFSGIPDPSFNLRATSNIRGRKPKKPNGCPKPKR